MIRARQDYMEWEDYLWKIAAIERIMFISETAEKSIKNYWRKRKWM